MTRYYWWLVANQGGQDTLIFGSDRGEEEARQKGLELLGGLDFKVVRLKSRNVAEAAHQFKGGKLERTHSLKKATERLSHKVKKKHLFN